MLINGRELNVKPYANLHGADLYGANLHGADLHGADLHGANLYGADLHGANLHGADLHGANLHGADLHGADLYGANLHGADLHGANLHGADLHGADLHGANLYGADLYGANLYGADLHGANLHGANLHGAKGLNPAVVLTAAWGRCSDSLTLDLMRYDASNHPSPKKFLKWAKGGGCPFQCELVVRAANFQENRDLIKDNFLDLPVQSAYQLMVRVLAEKTKQ